MSIAATHLPDILQGNDRYPSISVLRALKYAYDRLFLHLPEGEIDDADMVALDELEFMINQVASGKSFELTQL